jgi:TolB protein
LVFSHYPDKDCSGAPDIWSARRDGTGATQLTHTPLARELKPVWSPDGRRIAFASHPSPGFTVWTMASDGSDLRRLTPPALDASYPDWSPDGRRIVVTSHVDRNHSSIYVVDRNGSHLARLTTPPAGTRDSKPVWSPDGNSILYSSDSRSPGQFELYRLDTRTHVVRRLTHTPFGEYFSSWQPCPTGCRPC